MRLAPCALLIALGTLLSLYLPDAVAGAGLVGYDIISGRGLSHGLFATIGDATTQPGLTQWPVTIDIGALGTLPISLRLNLPERAAVDLSRDRSEQRGSGRYLWTGHGGDCTAVLDNGFAGMTGVLSCLNANYKIGSGDGALQLTRYDPNPLGPPAPVEDTTDSGGGGELYGLQGQEQALSPLSDDVIDVLVLYQEPVRAALDPDGGRTHTYALAQLAIDTLQDAIDQSEADAAVQLVSAREVSRTTYGYLPDDLDWLRTDPEPLGLRNQWAADVIVYLTLSGGNAYGISTVPGSTAPPNPPVPPPGPGYAPDAQAVVQYNTAVLDETGSYPQEPYVFLHEFGHVIGANHNHEDAGNNTTPLESGAYGYWRVSAKNGSERTIMSYATGQCLRGGACTRIMYYSNPNVTDDWFPTGVTNYADNAKLFRDYWGYAAQYRASLGRIFADGFEN